MQTEYLDGYNAFLIHGFLTAEECRSFVARSEATQYQEATITSYSGFILDKEIRDNARVILDDFSLAGELWQRARPLLPAKLGNWQIVGLNERFRFYRYDSGQKFAPHYDGEFRRPNGE